MIFFFQALQVASWTLKICSSLVLESYISQNIRNSFVVGCFLFSKLGMFPPEISKSCARKFCFWKYKRNIFLRKYKKRFFWENIRKLVIVVLERFISQNIRIILESIRNFLFLGLENSVSSNIRISFLEKCKDFLSIEWKMH